MNPKIAQTIYQLGVAVSAVVGVLLVWGGIDAGAADSVNQIIGGLVALIPGATSAVAAKRVSEQRKDGTLDKVAPADAAVTAIQQTVENVSQAQAELDKVKQAATDALSAVPGAGPLTQKIIDSLA
ncbi:hypothetical protein [Mycobacterium sp. CnD-18-1]|uniref:hypothetical protein n=1 Tax=Mycobacterium sp. CnD-18-1 TaxID=2917744 RepID=UPI001EF31BED|nr:hypothetical protein [Mycobacterium sp. CnD-18-1]MCG7607067.1 hypothetical protein [Mycobacterium sp. CnD-18-1]